MGRAVEGGTCKGSGRFQTPKASLRLAAQRVSGTRCFRGIGLGRAGSTASSPVAKLKPCGREAAGGQLLHHGKQDAERQQQSRRAGEEVAEQQVQSSELHTDPPYPTGCPSSASRMSQSGHPILNPWMDEFADEVRALAIQSPSEVKAHPLLNKIPEK